MILDGERSLQNCWRGQIWQPSLKGFLLVLTFPSVQQPVREGRQHFPHCFPAKPSWPFCAQVSGSRAAVQWNHSFYSFPFHAPVPDWGWEVHYPSQLLGALRSVICHGLLSLLLSLLTYPGEKDNFQADEILIVCPSTSHFSGREKWIAELVRPPAP